MSIPSTNIIVMAAALSFSVAPHYQAPADRELNAGEIVSRVTPFLVSVSGQDAKGEATPQGPGVRVSADRVAVGYQTIKHAINLQVATAGGEVLAANLIEVNRARTVALLAVRGVAPAESELSGGRAVKPGNKVFVVPGSGGGSPLEVTANEVVSGSAIAVTPEVPASYSGSPAFNSWGELIGLVAGCDVADDGSLQSTAINSVVGVDSLQRATDLHQFFR
jgi:hypothetical protein